MTDLAELFRRQTGGPRDIFTGKVSGGGWGHKFCDEVAEQLALAQCGIDLRRAQALGMQRMSIGCLRDRVEVSMSYDSRAWKVGVHETDIIEAVRRSYQGFHK